MESFDYYLNITTLPNCDTTEFVPDPRSDFFAPASKIFYLVIYILLFIFCVTASSFLFYAIIVTRKTTISILITNHSIAGLMIVFMSFLFYYVAVANRANWTAGWFVCKTEQFFQSTLLMVTSFTIVVMSCYKCKAVMNPTIECSPKQKNAMLVCGLIWGLAIFFALPYIFMSGLQKNWYTCQNFCSLYGSNPTFVRAYLICVGLFEYYLPVLVLAVTHGCIWWKLNQKNNVATNAGSHNLSAADDEGSDELKDKQQAKMLTAVALTFIILLLPWNNLNIFSLLFFHLNVDIFMHLTIIAHILLIFSIFCYSAIYIKMAPKFNEVMKGTWFWLKFCNK
ncbi:hypothetical protein HELRODRAFT_193389 [Helobdella robusta]|uniref:G-protein coupled receptors family 1 profile domain-containing protein n=1 Tax=Helobdella robusta TaxID=6412 RepID=T1FUX9_HELRO|nr:hypothetical protein HELRODRAFT_193389 [Helobdella robusta]ESN96858.1 hypothetical protein HELRODRAFT_193389 [Helobdella robusta]